MSWVFFLLICISETILTLNLCLNWSSNLLKVLISHYATKKLLTLWFIWNLILIIIQTRILKLLPYPEDHVLTNPSLHGLVRFPLLCATSLCVGFVLLEPSVLVICPFLYNYFQSTSVTALIVTPCDQDLIMAWNGMVSCHLLRHSLCLLSPITSYFSACFHCLPRRPFLKQARSSVFQILRPVACPHTSSLWSLVQWCRHLHWTHLSECLRLPGPAPGSRQDRSVPCLPEAATPGGRYGDLAKVIIILVKV